MTINIELEGKRFPIMVNDTTEEQLTRKAGDLAKKVLKDFDAYNIADRELKFLMCALVLAKEIISEFEAQTEHQSSFIDQINRLEKLAEKIA
jgi:cell division protein ZapA (FtsZ GTPase activity inhibitor)